MTRQARCPGCFRRHKASHERRVLRQRPYTPHCTVYTRIRTERPAWMH